MLGANLGLLSYGGVTLMNVYVFVESYFFYLLSFKLRPTQLRKVSLAKYNSHHGNIPTKSNNSDIFRKSRYTGFRHRGVPGPEP